VKESGLAHLVHSGSQTALIWAIVANTMPAAFWTLFHVLRCPAAFEAVQREIEAVRIPGEPVKGLQPWGKGYSPW
jgi:hypothetical protein